LIVIGLKEEIATRRYHRLDLKGAAVLLLGLLLLFYALAESSQSMHPMNAETLGLLAFAWAILTGFLFIERRTEEPIIPLDLFQLALFRTSVCVAALASMGVFGAVSYLPLYLQGVRGLTASRAGMVLLVLSLGWTAGSLLAGQLINRRGYRFVSAFGMGLMAAGYGLFVIRPSSTTVAAVLMSAILIGIGMGFANLATLVAAQNAVWSQRIGVATSTIMLFRTSGGAFAVSLMGTVLLNQMHRGLAQSVARGDARIAAELHEKVANPQNLLEPVTRALIPPELLPSLIAILADAIWYAFATAFVLMLVGMAASFFMAQHTPLNTPRPSDSPTSSSFG
jgi:hypothetical protein